jgi:hypothetical protein
MSNKQQTAVEWLIEQILNNENIRWRGTILIELSEKAKEMEKGQIKDAFVNGFCNAHDTEDKSLNADTIFYRTRYGGNK